MIKAKLNYNMLQLMGYLVLILANCSITSDEEPIWDTDIPPSEDFEAINAEWSRDGSKIYFQHNDFSDQENIIQNHIWVYDLNINERSSVYDNQAYNVDVNQSDDKILFHSPISPFGIYEFDIKSNATIQITNVNGINEYRNAIGGRYSPDYSKILATVFAGEPRGIIVMDSSGAKPEMVVEYGIMGDWFPNGDKIIYVGWSEDLKSAQIFEINLDGTNKTQLTRLQNTQNLAGPLVSPNGDKIAFANNGEDSISEIFLMDYTSGEITQITSGPGIANRISWHPNGEKLLFNRTIESSNSRLYIIDVNTLEVEPVFKIK